jgi:hypothetical protein
MTDDNQRRDATNNQDLDRSGLDRELDAALAKLVAVEPRAGLEDRILANLRANREPAAGHLEWRWPAIAALAAVIVVAIFVAWKAGKPVQNITIQQPPATMQTNEHAGTQVANRGGSGSIRPHGAAPGKQPKPHAISYSATVVNPAPKLEQFPSPQPLSEQEKMLAEYVADHRQQAVLIARARMAELKKDWVEEMEEEASETSNRPISDSTVIQQENR